MRRGWKCDDYEDSGEVFVSKENIYLDELIAGIHEVDNIDDAEPFAVKEGYDFFEMRSPQVVVMRLQFQQEVA